MSSRATGRVARAMMVSWLVLVIKADELDRPAWTLRRGLPMEVHELAMGVAESFGVFAIFDVETVLRSPAITPFVTQTLYSIPLELRRAACDRDRLKADSARKEMARIISAALLA
ncbi:hypothetical protein [Sinorhizobium meliloti]|uniref:hypothetical protein n=1 Tax=Rhizobium meliloti TaxID=382 RepID=UPI00307700D1